MTEEMMKPKENNALPLYPLEKERELLGYVKLGDRTRAKEILNDVLGSIFFCNVDFLEQEHVEIMKARILELVVVLSRAAVEGGASLEKLLGYNFKYIQELLEIKPVEEIWAWTVKVLDHFIDAVYESRNTKNFKLITEAMEYIKENYNKELTLDEVAQSVFISPYYLSHLFKDELGKTFVEYLTEVRINEAKKLLKNTKKSITRIAEEVGYYDSSYFSKVFKKQEGMTPQQYRRLI